MAGAIPTNIKKSELAEDVGRLLIRSFCAIAPISRADDFGIDTIATLLELDTNSNLRELATSSFALQFKAKSIREVPFLKQHQAKWLVNLDFPYFICSVNLENASIELYTINYLTSLPDYYAKLKSFILHLDEVKIIDNKLRFTLGPPILTMSIADITNKPKLDILRKVLRCWIKLDLLNIRQRKLGKTTSISWVTNGIPEINASHKILMAGGENMEILNESNPYIDATLTELKLKCQDTKLAESIDYIVKKLNSLGINLDTYNTIPFEEYQKNQIN